jgi:hypothetical protein
MTQAISSPRRGLNEVCFRLQLLQGPEQRQPRAFEIHFVWHGREHFLGARHSGVGACFVEVFGALGYLRQDGHTVRQHFGEAHRYGEVVLLVPLPVPHRPRTEPGEERRMSGEDAEVALLPRHCDFIDFVRERLVGRDDIQLQLRR